MNAACTWSFDDSSGSLDDIVFELSGDDTEADWNLGRDGAFWLSGTLDGPLSVGTIRVDMRSLDATIAALTRVSKTFYPLDQTQLYYPLDVRALDERRVLVHLELELDWDYYPAPTKPADYRPHRFTLDADARLVRA